MLAADPLAGPEGQVKRSRKVKEASGVSDTDSFIDEVTEEVRRDRLFKAMRKYGWIAVLAVIAIVGGAAWNEWNKAQARAAAEEFGDQMLAALAVPDASDRADALSAVVRHQVRPARQ